MDTYAICYEQFYRVIARYLLEERLVDKLELDSKHLVVHDIRGDIFEFTLCVNHLGGGVGE